MKILDCTLRDGGYYTNWDFDKLLVEQYLKAMEALPVDYVELGYRNNQLSGYYGEYYYLPDFVLKFCKDCCPTTKLAVMLNVKDTEITDLNKLLISCKQHISLIRLATAPTDVEKAIELSKQIKKMGFEVGLNIMYMSKWLNIDGFFDKIEKTNNLVDYLWLVDSFGGVFPDEIKKIIAEVRKKTNAKLGFHGHNNLEMAFFNSITAVENGCDIVDATITGMGRGAGNLKTELLLSYLSKTDKNIDLNELTSVVSIFESLRKEYEWGTNMPYMISGVNSLPQKDIMEFMSKKRYSVSNIVRTLQRDTNQNSTRFSLLKTIQKENDILIIGGGDTIQNHILAIQKFIKQSEHLSIVFSSAKHLELFDFTKKLNNERFFCLVGDEGVRIEKKLDFVQDNDVFVLPLFSQKMNVYVPEKIKKQAFEMAENQIDCVLYGDSPLLLGLEIALQTTTNDTTVFLVGFDGYTDNFRAADKYDLMTENQEVINKFVQQKELKSLTPTKYSNLSEISIYSFL